MKTVGFYARTNRSGNLLHVETDGCVVDIRVGLFDADGQPITRVDVMPDQMVGQEWDIHPEDGNGVTRVVRRRPLATFEGTFQIRSGVDGGGLVCEDTHTVHAPTPEAAKALVEKWVWNHHPMADERIDPAVTVVDVTEIEED